MNRAFKPYDLVNVQQDGYRHIGEVISLPTPASTIMIRCVPGHPGTLQEISLDALTPVERKARSWYVHYATVAGRGQFPVDMLRYDYAAPVNFTLRDKRNGWGYIVADLDPSHGLADLVIATASPQARPDWTSARWSSFLWGVRHLRTEKLERA